MLLKLPTRRDLHLASIVSGWDLRSVLRRKVALAGVFLAVALLTSCDPGTPYQYFLDVTNGCTGDLYVIVTRDGNGSRGDFTKVAAGAMVTVHPIRDGLYVPDGTIIVTATLRDGDPAVFDDPDFEHDPNVAIGSLRDVVVTNTPGIGEGGSYRIEGDLCRVAEPSNP